MQIKSFVAVVVLLLGSIAHSADRGPVAGQAETVQGYAAGCTLAVYQGMPLLLVNLYKTREEVIASTKKQIRPGVAAVLEIGPGITLSQLNPKSQVKAICMAVESLKAQKPITLRMNGNGAIETASVLGTDIKSDSFALMPPNAQEAISELLKQLERAMKSGGEGERQSPQRPQEEEKPHYLEA